MECGGMEAALPIVGSDGVRRTGDGVGDRGLNNNFQIPVLPVGGRVAQALLEILRVGDELARSLRTFGADAGDGDGELARL